MCEEKAPTTGSPTDRAESIEMRAKELGWGFSLTPTMFCITLRTHKSDLMLRGGVTVYDCYFAGNPENADDLDIAECLLAFYEPGPVARVDKCPEIMMTPESMRVPRKIAVDIPRDLPPGTYKLVKVDDGK